MKWLIVPSKRGKEIAEPSERPCHGEAAFSADFNSPLSEQDGGVCLAPPEIETDEERLSDLNASRAAIEESDERIPYDRVRRELGLD